MAEESVHTKNQCESSDDEDQEATAKFLEVIDQRFRDGDFPARRSSIFVSEIFTWLNSLGFAVLCELF